VKTRERRAFDQDRNRFRWEQPPQRLNSRLINVRIAFGFVGSSGKVGPDAAAQFQPGERPRCAFPTLDDDGGGPNR